MCKCIFVCFGSTSNVQSSSPSSCADRSRSCPYLDTIDRSVLDFDFEKLCSISLSNNNVYACLICGKYFQGIADSCTPSDHLTLRPCTTQVFPLSFLLGRGRASHAYTHSVQVDHHVFLNLHTLKVTAPSLMCLASHHSAFLHTTSPPSPPICTFPPSPSLYDPLILSPPHPSQHTALVFLPPSTVLLPPRQLRDCRLILRGHHCKCRDRLCCGQATPLLSRCHLFHLPAVCILSVSPSPPLPLWSLACVAANIHSGSDQGNGPHPQMGGSPGWQEVPPRWVMCLSCDLGHVTVM